MKVSETEGQSTLVAIEVLERSTFHSCLKRGMRKSLKKWVQGKWKVKGKGQEKEKEVKGRRECAKLENWFDEPFGLEHNMVMSSQRPQYILYEPT